MDTITINISEITDDVSITVSEVGILINDVKATATGAVKATATGAVKSTATGTVKDTAAAAVKGTTTATVKDTAAGAVKGTATAAVKDTAAAAVKSTAASAIKATAAASVKDTAAGSIKATATAAIQDTEAAEVKDTATGAIKATAASAVKATAASAVKATATGAVKDTATGSIKDTATAAIKNTAAAAVKNTATGSIKDTATGSIKDTTTASIKDTAAATVKATATGTVLDSDLISIADLRSDLDMDDKMDIDQTTPQTMVGTFIFPTVKVGDVGSGDYTEFEADGTIKFHGDATVFRDEMHTLIHQSKNNAAARMVDNVAEGSLTYKDNATVADYAVMSIQLNHDRKNGAAVYPHLHWWQTSINMPNWLLQHRWQRNGQAKVTDWTYLAWVENAYDWGTAAGTLNQITRFGSITPPSDDNVSDILQIRLMRDVANASTEFAATAETDPIDQDAVSFDVHIEIDGIGSREEYVK